MGWQNPGNPESIFAMFHWQKRPSSGRPRGGSVRRPDVHSPTGQNIKKPFNGSERNCPVGPYGGVAGCVRTTDIFARETLPNFIGLAAFQDCRVSDSILTAAG